MGDALRVELEYSDAVCLAEVNTTANNVYHEILCRIFWTEYVPKRKCKALLLDTTYSVIDWLPDLFVRISWSGRIHPVLNV